MLSTNQLMYQPSFNTTIHTRYPNSIGHNLQNDTERMVAYKWLKSCKAGSGQDCRWEAEGTFNSNIFITTHIHPSLTKVNMNTFVILKCTV